MRETTPDRDIYGINRMFTQKIKGAYALGGKSFFIVLLVVVALLTLTLFALSAYIFFGGGGEEKTSDDQSSHKVVTEPKPEELEKLKVFGDKSEILNLKKTSNDQMAVIRLNVVIKYYKKLEKLSEEEVHTLVTDNDSEIKELIRMYFRKKPLDEVNKDDFFEKAKKELKVEINKLLLDPEPVKGDLIYDVIFEDVFVQ